MRQLLKATSLAILPNRQRQEFEPEALMHLCESIEKLGLMHPPVVRQMVEYPDQLVLVAGERRFRAMQQIWELGGFFSYNGEPVPQGYIPYCLITDLDELSAEEAELDENLKRKDLTWQEQVAALSRLEALRGKQAVKANLPAPTPATLALELTGKSEGSNQDAVRKSLIVARNLDNPDVAKAKTVNEAFKILKSQEVREDNARLAATVGASFKADLHTILNVNCLEWMANAQPSQFDVILTDPPYGMGAHEFGDAGGKLTGTNHDYDDSYETWLTIVRTWAPLSYRLAKPEAHAYVFCDFDRFHELKGFMEAAGWYVFRTPIISYKLNSGRVPLPEHGPRRQYELCLYAIKGKKPVTHIYPDVIPCSAEENSGHGAGKPVALMQNLLQRSIRPGDTVLDSFAGSGSVITAGHTLQCTVTALERDPSSYGLCIRRAQDLKNSENLLGGLS